MSEAQYFYLVDLNFTSTTISIQRQKSTIQETTYHQKAFLGYHLACLQLQGNKIKLQVTEKIRGFIISYSKKSQDKTIPELINSMAQKVLKNSGPFHLSTLPDLASCQAPFWGASSLQQLQATELHPLMSRDRKQTLCLISFIYLC